MGLITGLVSTVVHVAAGRNPYASSSHNQAGSQPVVTTAGYVADPSYRSADYGCAHGSNGQPCSICAVALPFGKGRQQKRDRRAMRHAAKAQRFSHGRYPAYLPGAGAPQHQDYYYPQQQVMYRGGPSTRQEEGVGRAEMPAVEMPVELPCESRRRASTGAERPMELPCENTRRASTGDDVPPPSYEEAESSAVAARRSVEVLQNEKRALEGN